MARKLRRSPPPRRNVDYATDPSPSQSFYASNEDDYDASESINFQPTNSAESAAETGSSYINIAPLPVFRGGADECPAMHLSRFAKVCRANNAAAVDTMMRIFPVTLEGEAALWYDLNIEPYPPVSWEELKSLFMEAFSRIELTDQLQSELMTINQRDEENVRSYFLRLQLILKKWPMGYELSDGLLKGIFMDGLREEFKEWMIPQKPSSLNEALRLAFGFEQVRSVRTSDRNRFLRCGFCEGPHQEVVCEVRERMRLLWKSREEKKAVDEATAELTRSVSARSRNEAAEEDGGKKKSQCQCGKHQCGMKKLDRSFSMVSKSSKG